MCYLYRRTGLYSLQYVHHSVLKSKDSLYSILVSKQSLFLGAEVRTPFETRSYRRAFFSSIFQVLEIIGDKYQGTEAFCPYILVKFSRSRKKTGFTKCLENNKSGKSGRWKKNARKKHGTCGKKKLSDKNDTKYQLAITTTVYITRVIGSWQQQDDTPPGTNFPSRVTPKPRGRHTHDENGDSGTIYYGAPY